jgi:hypothetical protein
MAAIYVIQECRLPPICVRHSGGSQRAQRVFDDSRGRLLRCKAQRVFDCVTNPQKNIVSGLSFPFVPVAIVDEVDGRIDSGGESADAVESKREATHSGGRDGGHLWQSIFL